MIFRLDTTYYAYSGEKLEKLKRYGFEFEKREGLFPPPPGTIGKNYSHEVYIKIDTLEDLKKLADDFNEELIVDFQEMSIEIYDNYRE